MLLYSPLMIVSGVDYSGYQLPFAPKWSGNFSYQHTWELDNKGAVSARVETHLETATWVIFSELKGSHQPDYSNSSIYLTYDFPDGKWTVTGYVKNVENTAVLVNAQSGPGPSGLVAGDIAPPRTYGVQLTARF